MLVAQERQRSAEGEPGAKPAQQEARFLTTTAWDKAVVEVGAVETEGLPAEAVSYPEGPRRISAMLRLTA